MLQKLHKNRGGFTLVEIMIVVSIIALLASIAVPNFLRARKRAQATTVLEDMRIIDAAKEQFAIETNAPANVDVTWEEIQPYLKEGSRLRNSTQTDTFGRTITIGSPDTAPTLDATTLDELRSIFSGDAVAENKFWGPYDGNAN
jgi:prepilin-type N-terminal cleavage/methylation domain-containing protein